ncbi:hypothetical protein Tco_0036555 [Tanacetum coccineum]
MVLGLFYLEYEGIIAYTLWMAMEWHVSLMLVLKKKTVLHRFGIKDWDISVRRDYRGFEQLCIESGIARHLTVAETGCRTSPSRAIEKKTPIEMWSGHPSDYGMLRIFDCVAYPHNKQCKLEPKAVKCVLLGYPEGVKGNKLYRLDDE